MGKYCFFSWDTLLSFLTVSMLERMCEDWRCVKMNDILISTAKTNFCLIKSLQYVRVYDEGQMLTL